MPLFHIRRPLRRLGGNQFYKDKGPRLTGAYCGGEVTDMDAGWRDTAQTWTHPERGVMVPCAECVRVRHAEGGRRIEATFRNGGTL